MSPKKRGPSPAVGEPKDTNAPDRLLRIADVKSMVGFGVTQIYVLMKRRAFPRPRAFSSRAVRWSQNEIQAWIQARLAERPTLSIHDESGASMSEQPRPSINKTRRKT